MSRDFMVRCSSAEQAARVQSVLEGTRIPGDDSPVFDSTIKVIPFFARWCTAGTSPRERWSAINERDIDFSRATAFVAVKNGQHNGVGYLMDTDMRTRANSIPLAAIFSLISEHFDTSLAAS